MNPSDPNQQNAVPETQPDIIPAGEYRPPNLPIAGQEPKEAAPSNVPPTAPAARQASGIEEPPPPPPTVQSGTMKPAPTAGAKTKGKNPNSTQNTLQIAEVRDGIVIMNDGSFRSVVMVKSINFDLMSPQEQEAVEYSYQGFLNSLYFPIQIFLRSRKVDLRPYIERLDKIRSEHDNMLLALLMEDYIEYISNLSQQTNIMDKNFYVVIPYYPEVTAQKAVNQSKSFFSGVGNIFSKKEQHVVINEADLENAKTELRNRVQAVIDGLLQASIQGLPLDTEELIELYYDTYNPDTATRQNIKDFNSLSADVITKGQGAAPQAHLKREMQ